jgi:hypothetical protein
MSLGLTTWVYPLWGVAFLATSPALLKQVLRFLAIASATS